MDAYLFESVLRFVADVVGVVGVVDGIAAAGMVAVVQTDPGRSCPVGMLRVVVA